MTPEEAATELTRESERLGLYAGDDYGRYRRTVRDRLHGLQYRIRFEWTYLTKCRHFWFTPTLGGSTHQLHKCEGWRGHGGLHHHDGVTDDGTGG